jgi:hypothetical protein
MHVPVAEKVVVGCGGTRVRLEENCIHTQALPTYFFLDADAYVTLFIWRVWTYTGTTGII